MIKMSLFRLSEISLLVFALSIPFTRLVGGLNLFVFFAVSLALSIRINARYKLPSSLIWLCVLGLIYVAISTTGIFPKAWTRYFELAAIPQQALFLYAMPTALLVISFYLKRNLNSRNERKELALKLFTVWLILKAIGFLFFSPDSEAEGSSLLQQISISGMGSISSLIIVATTLYLSTIKKPLDRLPVLVVFSVLCFLSPFSQNKIFAFFFFLIWIFPRHALKILIALISISIAVYLYGYSAPYSLYGVDENLTVRIVLLKDAVSGFLNTYFIGVGFGTEAISNYYALFYNPTFHDENELGFIHLAHHNSFATVAFRLGALGLLFLLMFMYQTIREVRVEGHCNERAVKCSVFAAFFVVTFLNPALESFVYLYGVCLYLGVVWAFSYTRITKQAKVEPDNYHYLLKNDRSKFIHQRIRHTLPPIASRGT